MDEKISRQEFEQMQQEVARLSAIAKEHEANWNEATKLLALLTVVNVAQFEGELRKAPKPRVGFAPGEVN